MNASVRGRVRGELGVRPRLERLGLVRPLEAAVARPSATGPASAAAEPAEPAVAAHSAAEAARAAAATARVSIEVNLAAVQDEEASLELIAQTGKAGDIITRAERISAAVREQIRG